jgi:hypothetical protein
MEQLDANSPIIPSDTIAFKLYSKALTELHNHNLDPLKLEEAMSDFGAVWLSSGRSDWIIDVTNTRICGRRCCTFDWPPQLRVVDGTTKSGWLERDTTVRPLQHPTWTCFSECTSGRWEPKEPVDGDMPKVLLSGNTIHSAAQGDDSEAIYKAWAQ